MKATFGFNAQVRFSVSGDQLIKTIQELLMVKFREFHVKSNFIGLEIIKE
jgi:hypothetical protein